MLRCKKNKILKQLRKHQDNIRTGSADYLDLQGVDLRFSDLSSTRFELVNLTGADLSHSKLADCQFVSSSLNSASLAYCDLTGSEFRDTDITGISLTGCSADPSLFEQAFRLDDPCGSRETQNHHDQTVSVYMPTWNREALAIRAIQSVLKQDYPHWELIVIDDNSPDNSTLKAFIDDLADSRIHYIFNHFSSGACSVRNQAIEQAKGKYIAGIDDDDEWLPNRLTAFMKHQQLLDKFSFLYADDYVCEHKSYASIEELRLYPKPAFTPTLFCKRNIVGNQIFTLTERLRTILFDVNLSAAQDYDAFYRLSLEYGSPYKVKAPTQILYVNHGEVRITQSRKKFSGYLNFYRKHKADFDRSSRKYQLFTFYVIRHKKMSARTLLKLLTLRNLKRFVTNKLTLRKKKY